MKKHLALISLTSLIMFSCGKSPSDASIRPVRYMEVSLWSKESERTFSGVAQADIDAHLSFRVNGVIEALPIHIGQKIENGDVLAKLDPHDYELKSEEAHAAYVQAMAKVRQTASNYDRIRLLYEKNNASRNELDLARAEAESTAAALQVAEKRREFAKSQLNYTTLKAPFSGSIAAIPVELNENVAAGQHVLMLSSASKLEVSTSIPENLISQIHLDTPVQVTFDAITGKSFRGSVKEISIMSDVRTTFPVTIQIDIQSPEIRSGMTAEVHFSFLDASDKTIIPSHSLLEENNKEIVFIVEKTSEPYGKIQKRAVTVGKLSNNGIEILKGLEPGDLVVTAGIRRIKDGQKVLLQPEHQEKQR